MKIFLLGAAIAAILIATVPAIRDAGSSHSKSAAATPLPAPSGSGATGASAGAPSTKYRSPLGGNGGLGNASIAESAAGRIQVYTLTTLPGARDGQVVRIRLSRPKYDATRQDDKTYTVHFVDMDATGSASILFPAEGAEKLDLIQGHSQPGLTFYLALEPELRAVGQTWRPDSRTYTW